MQPAAWPLQHSPQYSTEKPTVNPDLLGITSYLSNPVTLHNIAYSLDLEHRDQATNPFSSLNATMNKCSHITIGISNPIHGWSCLVQAADLASKKPVHNRRVLSSLEVVSISSTQAMEYLARWLSPTSRPKISKAYSSLITIQIRSLNG